MSETLTFGPEWLRALSSGNSVTSPPPSPGPKYKLAEHRYGKEEMLALFSEDVMVPPELQLFDSICRTRPALPLAFQQFTEEEQRNSAGSVNSNAVLKLMGRGAMRGVGPPRGPGRGGIRGRGRGDGGYTRQTSYEDTRGEGGAGFGRGSETRRQGWSENSRGSFERSPSLRESGPSGPGRGGYDPSLARPRLSSDTSWERAERRSDSGNWRSGDDDDGWRISGQRSSDRSDKWRGGGPSRGRASWRGGTESYRERGHPDDEWQTARGSRRSYHDNEDVRWGSSYDRLPEWSNDDNEDFTTPGTFDSSGAFVSKQKEEDSQSKDERKYVENRDKNMGNQSESDDEEPPDVWDDEDKDAVQTKHSDSGTRPVSEGKPPETLEQQKPPAAKPPSTHQTTDTCKPSPSTTTSPPPSPSHSSTSQQRTPNSTPSNAPNKPFAHVPPQAHITTSSTMLEQAAGSLKEEEPNMDHFAQAAENLVASLDDDEEEDLKEGEQPTTQQKQEYRSSPTTTEEVQWSYTDPQGKVQGPFSNSEMADWFSHGYFTMGLLVKRTIDEIFQPLGEIIKQWGRVPFTPGPQPPPCKVVPEHIQRQQQILAQQQQYQHLMQQHYLQQQLFHQQAMMMQQQQLQHSQQQMQQMQQMPPPPQHSPTQNSSSPMTQHGQPQAKQAGVHHLEQQPQQGRPQTLSPHAESIWGTGTPPQASPSIIAPGPWSPVTTTSAGKGWDTENSQQNVPSFEEIQRMEEEKEKQARLEMERREANARAMRLKQEEEERRRAQEAAMLKKQQQEDEERRQLQETERRRKEQEELRKEEARRKQEEELRRKQEQQEVLRQQEQQQRQQLEQQKAEQKRLHEVRQQQQQALLRLQQQQQELQRKKDLQIKAELQQRELQQKLHQKRQESQTSGGSLWGSPTPVSGTMSLTQIQQQEERDKVQREFKLQQLQAQQKREQQTRGVPGWGERPPVVNQPVKSLLQIQQEQAQQQNKRQQGSALSRSQPSHNPLSSSVWGNAGHLSASWGPAPNSANIWGSTPSKPPPPPQQQYDDEDDDEDDDDDDSDEEGGAFWDDAVKAASKSREQQQQQFVQQQRQQQKASQPQTNMTSDKRASRDEENLRRLFHSQPSVDEFSVWCDQALRSLNIASGIDIPTFSAFLRDVESPYEVYDYVKSYLGDNRETRDFAREFIERRKKQKDKIPASLPPFSQASVWGAPVPRGPSAARPTNMIQSGAFLSGPPQEDPQEAMNKKKRKKKMQKVDPSILGFSVNAADRVNMGEIQTVED
ncbi:GRB10-interacting GYF protein 2 isoform X2 [Pocillopora verrucosa]|uniref:GRB10-interacting GYF protein 2 isoform X2 n=1 Tax=Pocillopora verrucosa TaxID=203993 RepID=UPI003342A813